MAKRIITDIEYEAGCVALDPKRIEKFKTVEELQEDQVKNFKEYWGVNYDVRVEFLEANGYEVTRENLIDSTLSARPSED